MRWVRMALHLLAAAAILRVVFPRASSARKRALVRWWSAKLMRIVGVAIRVEGEPPGESEAGAMIAANHVSWLDVFVVSSVRATRFIAKSEIRDWPLAEGDRVGLFPEGFTTEGDQLLAFHSSLFEPAVANSAHVHPCAVRYEHADGSRCRAIAYVGEISFMQSLGLVIRSRGVVARLAFAPVVETAGRGRREVAAEAQAAVATLLGLAPADIAPRRPSGPPGAPP